MHNIEIYCIFLCSHCSSFYHLHLHFHFHFDVESQMDLFFHKAMVQLIKFFSQGNRQPIKIKQIFVVNRRCSSHPQWITAIQSEWYKTGWQPARNPNRSESKTEGAKVADTLFRWVNWIWYNLESYRVLIKQKFKMHNMWLLNEILRTVGTWSGSTESRKFAKNEHIRTLKCLRKKEN